MRGGQEDSHYPNPGDGGGRFLSEFMGRRALSKVMITAPTTCRWNLCISLTSTYRKGAKMTETASTGCPSKAN